ncbi:hypothetical protein [Radiobacillus sp. PE A8.2]|uniref:hypothetical protein n=1 Tax=Radiobacillus sp. PE A8.2 TaxID=3380349 RepID=UPI00388EBD5F
MTNKKINIVQGGGSAPSSFGFAIPDQDCNKIHLQIETIWNSGSGLLFRSMKIKHELER